MCPPEREARVLFTIGFGDGSQAGRGLVSFRNKCKVALGTTPLSCPASTCDFCRPPFPIFKNEFSSLFVKDPRCRGTNRSPSSCWMCWFISGPFAVFFRLPSAASVLEKISYNLISSDLGLQAAASAIQCDGAASLALVQHLRSCLSQAGFHTIKACLFRITALQGNLSKQSSTFFTEPW